MQNEDVDEKTYEFFLKECDKVEEKITKKYTKKNKREEKQQEKD